jgi:sugar lactone lactonase YvrE
LDKEGNLLVADTGNHKIRKIDFSTGKISTVVGKGRAAFSGDGGAASAAELNTPFGVIADGRGNIVIADSGNHRIRRVDAKGTISTFVGTGTPGFGGDGMGAAVATINFPTGLALDGEGNLILADTFNHRIRKLTPQPPMPPPGG